MGVMMALYRTFTVEIMIFSMMRCAALRCELNSDLNINIRASVAFIGS